MAVQRERKETGGNHSDSAHRPAARDKSAHDETQISRGHLIDELNSDLRREYQAIISYVIFSQVLKGAAYMDIARELEKHAAEELSHAITISKQIDYLGGEPASEPMPVRTGKTAEEMLTIDLENENETIRNYRKRVRQCEALGEFAIGEHIRQILVQEQEHQSDLATALGKDVPDVSSAAEMA